MKESKTAGVPGTIVLKHPKSGLKRVKATPELVKMFMPSAPHLFYAAMLGRTIA
jgi:hypothetical protein